MRMIHIVKKSLKSALCILPAVLHLHLVCRLQTDQGFAYLIIGKIGKFAPMESREKIICLKRQTSTQSFVVFKLDFLTLFLDY